VAIHSFLGVLYLAAALDRLKRQRALERHPITLVQSRRQ
jgi:hypothetical protein